MSPGKLPVCEVSDKPFTRVERTDVDSSASEGMLEESLEQGVSSL